MQRGKHAQRPCEARVKLAFLVGGAWDEVRLVR